MKKFTSTFNLIVLNTSRLLNSFHGQTSLVNTIFPVMISAVKLLLIGLKTAFMDMFSILHQLILFP